MGKFSLSYNEAAKFRYDGLPLGSGESLKKQLTSFQTHAKLYFVPHCMGISLSKRITPRQARIIIGGAICTQLLQQVVSSIR